MAGYTYFSLTKKIFENDKNYDFKWCFMGSYLPENAAIRFEKELSRMGEIHNSQPQINNLVPLVSKNPRLPSPVIIAEDIGGLKAGDKYWLMRRRTKAERTPAAQRALHKWHMANNPEYHHKKVRQAKNKNKNLRSDPRL